MKYGKPTILLLDIYILDQTGNINRPWLTIIMDDYSRAIAGYFISFEAPNAQNTALTLHQAIWNKNNTIGQYVVYPKISTQITE